MPQLTIYFDDETATLARTAAEKQGISLSRFVAEAVRERLATQWPADVLAMMGEWADEPDDLFRRDDLAADTPREVL